MKPSSELISQLVPKRYIADFLSRWCQKPKWEEKHRTSELEIEFWANGLWIKQCGIVKYNTFANFVIHTSNMRAIGLQVKPLSETVTLVQGSQSPWYAVHHQDNGHLKCECMLYRNRANRLHREVPHLYRALHSQVFCHHTAAVRPIDYI